uniref:V-type proton ATPase subunit n=1 Tax=Mesocestoides corti TaxID=53468 RepID=A0A5K3EXW9_MESCO
MQIGLYLPVVVLSGFWALVLILGPLFVPKSPNRGLWIVSLVLTSVCCYLFWLIFYIAQWHPFYGPILSAETVRILKNKWDPKW